jgi:hypothetical protein
MAFSDLWPVWAGGTAGVPAPTTYGGDAQIPVSGFADPGRQGIDSLTPGAAQSSFGNNDLVQALQALGKSGLAKQPDATPLAPAKITEAVPGRPRQAASLDALAQLLERQRAQYGGLTGQPMAQPRQLGLLGF